MPSCGGLRGDGAVRRRRFVELGHHAEHGDAALGVDGGERVEGRQHRRRVGVVGVVDDDAAGGRADDAHAHRRHARPSPGRRPRSPGRSRARRRRRRPPRRSTAMCAPLTASATSVRPHGVATVNRGRASASRRNPSMRTSAPARPAERHHRRRSCAPAIAATRASSALSTAVPVGRQRARPARPWRGRRPSMPPTRSVCDGADGRHDADVRSRHVAQAGRSRRTRACPSRARAPPCRPARRAP